MHPLTSRRSGWKDIYPIIQAAVTNLEPVDSLLRQIVATLSLLYQSDCLLVTGLEIEQPENIKVYGTPQSLETLQREWSCVPLEVTAETCDPKSSRLQLAEPDANAPELCSDQVKAIQFQGLQSLPGWLLQQLHQPQIVQLETGALVVPAHSGTRLRFVLHLQRSSQPWLLNRSARRLGLQRRGAARTQIARPGFKYIQGWFIEEVEALEIVCSQLVFALDALYWRERLEQSRHQAALMGRIVRLVNSSLNPNEVMEYIVAELGRGMESDRTILVNLQTDPVEVLTVWDHPQSQCLGALQNRQLERTLWQEIIELFAPGETSYLELTQAEAGTLKDWLQENGAASALMMPLFVQNEFFGAVLLLSCGHDRVYELDELQTIRQVADQAAVALSNAQTYQSLWSHQEKLKLQNRSLQIESIHDSLTHLLNRRSLQRQLDQLSQLAPNSVPVPFTIIVCDVDHFKQVNDTYGHLVGDEVLQSLAQRLQKQLRLGTTLYRYGGEEFVVLLMGVVFHQALEIAERLRAAVRSHPFQTAAGLLMVTASFGVASQEIQKDQDAWNVLRRADRALYEAKQQGRDQVVVD